MNIANDSTVFLPPAKAESIRAALAAGDPDWTYSLGIINDYGLTRVLIHDEDGEYVGDVTAQLAACA